MPHPRYLNILYHLTVHKRIHYFHLTLSFLKEKVGLRDHLHVRVCVCVCPPHQLLTKLVDFYEIRYRCQATQGDFDAI
jgi:hypothetical protein